LVTSSEADYEEYLAQKAKVAAKRQAVANLQEWIKEYERILGQFMVEYHAKVGTLQVQLDKINLEIEEIRFRIGWLSAREASKGMEERLREEFAGYREQVEADEFASTNARTTYDEILETEHLSPERKQELKHLYRELAKRFHPDLADSEEDRARRNGIMAEVNTAYAREDLNALKEMLERYEWVEAEARAETWTDKIEALDKEDRRLDRLLADLKQSLAEIEGSGAFQLWQSVQQAAEQGRDLLEELCADLDWEIERRLDELAYQQTRYKEMVEAQGGA
jgi:hypothetical protein